MKFANLIIDELDAADYIDWINDSVVNGEIPTSVTKYLIVIAAS